MRAKKIFPFVLVISLLFPFISSCGDDDDDKKPTYPINVDISNVGLPELYRFITPEKNSIYIANSETELNEFVYNVFSGGIVNAPSKPEETVKFDIDFKKYTVILFEGASTSGIEKIVRELIRTADKTYVLNIKITQDMTAVAPTYQIAILAPKIASDATITPNVTIVN